MQVVSAMLVVSVFLMAVAFTDGYQMGAHRYLMRRHHPYSRMNNPYHYNRGYSNNRNGRNGDSDQYSNGMSYLPYLMASDSENEQQLATYSMMMNQGQGNNYLSYYYMMQNGMEKAWPMMAFMNGGQRGGQGLDPYSMMMMMQN